MEKPHLLGNTTTLLLHRKQANVTKCINEDKSKDMLPKPQKSVQEITVVIDETPVTLQRAVVRQ